MTPDKVIIGKATLYLGDCSALHSIRADALISDVPYGVSERTSRKSNGRGKGGEGRLQGAPAGARDWRPIAGDNQPFDPAPWLGFPKVVLFGANHFCSRLPAAKPKERPYKWLIWDKREEVASDDNADCEMIWTNLRGPARIHRQLWRGICRRGVESNNGPRLHPTQKPLALMEFCVSQCRLDLGSIVFDPYMGSGSTGVAALKQGHRFVGCEIDPEYFATACRRVEDVQRQSDMLMEARA